MGDVVIVHSPHDVADNIPDNTQRVYISSIQQGIDTSTVFIESFVKKKWPLQKIRRGSLMKVVLADGNNDFTDNIDVYFRGGYADQSATLCVGDTVAMSNFFVEKCTKPAQSRHACQIVLDEDRTKPNICILIGHPWTQTSSGHNRSIVASPSKRSSNNDNSDDAAIRVPVPCGLGRVDNEQRAEQNNNAAPRTGDEPADPREAVVSDPVQRGNQNTENMTKSPVRRGSRNNIGVSSSRQVDQLVSHTARQSKPQGARDAQLDAVLSSTAPINARQQVNLSAAITNNFANVSLSSATATPAAPCSSATAAAAAPCSSATAAPCSSATAAPAAPCSSATAAPAAPLLSRTAAVVAKYVYKKLKNLEKSTVVNIYGIVKFVKQPSRTRGTDYMMLISIVDESLDSLSHKLKCVFFARDQSTFPTQVEVGDIIRVHRLKISEFNGEMQGKNGPGFSFLLFENATGASLTPKFKSTNHYTISEDDYAQVEALRAWWSSLQLQDPDEETPLPRSVPLHSIQCGQYFDLTCQVVGICAMSPREGCLLKVWDGTKPAVNVWEVDIQERTIACDDQLARETANYLVDVCLFDNHFEKASECQVGDFVKLFNLHAMKHRVDGSEAAYSAVQSVELCLHGGTSYGRGMRILDPTDAQVGALKKKLDEWRAAQVVANDSASAPAVADPSPPGRVTRSAVAQQNRTPTKEATQHDLRRSPRIKEKHGTSPGKGSSRKRLMDALPSTSGKRPLTEESSTPRCMVNTATVITGHHHIQPSSITDIQAHSVPYKFRLQGRLLDYQPRVNSAKDLLKLQCHKCHFLSSLPESRAAAEAPDTWAGSATTDQVHDGVPRYHCPNCTTNAHDQLTTGAGAQMLEYVFAFQLIISDGTGWLVAQLVKDEAEKFFNDTGAEEVLRERRVFQWVTARLRELCPTRGSDNARPLMEVCLKSYSTPSTGLGTSYQLFDTVLAQETDS